MRALTLLAALAALAIAGCGGGDEQPSPAPVATIDDGVSEADGARPALAVSEAVPTKAALAAKPSPELRTRLDAGAVALVDVTGRMDIRPRTIEYANGGRLLEIEWVRWDDREAVGRGRSVSILCEPNCARGEELRASATIRLSKPVACPQGRFFDLGKLEVESGDTPTPTSWLAAPC